MHSATPFLQDTFHCKFPYFVMLMNMYACNWMKVVLCTFAMHAGYSIAILIVLTAVATVNCSLLNQGRGGKVWGVGALPSIG